MSRIINIISGKGGTGKTTVAINLAAALTHFGEDVLLVDADIETPNVGVLLGAADTPFTLTDYLKKRNAKLTNAIYKTSEGFKILPCSLSYNGKTNVARLKTALKQARKLANYIIVDCPPGIGEVVQNVAKESDESIIVTNPEITALTDNIKAISVAESYENTILGVIVNKVTHAKFESKPSEVEGMLDYPIIGALPSEKTVKIAARATKSVINHAPKSKFSKQMKTLAAKLAHKNYDPKKDSIGFWQRLMFWKNF